MQQQNAFWNSTEDSSPERERIPTGTSSQDVVHNLLWIAVDMWKDQPSAVSQEHRTQNTEIQITESQVWNRGDNRQ
jgi:hypothetical protein